MLSWKTLNTSVNDVLADPSRRRFVNTLLTGLFTASLAGAGHRITARNAAYQHSANQMAARLSRRTATPPPIALPGMPPLSPPLIPQQRVTQMGEVRDLALYNTNTHESARIVFFANGSYNPQALQQLNILLRDHHENVGHVMDVDLLTLVHDMQKVFDNRPVHILSAYRTRATQNALIREGATRARDSYHVKGRAIDLRFPGVPVSALRDVAKIFRAGGVGYYPWARFIHVDTGPVRYW